MSSPHMIFLLLALLSGGFAHASHPFDDVPRASDEELDRMRGGFVVNWNGQDFLMPFSIDGIERLTQINGQTFINGALVAPRVNPQALVPFAQIGRIGVNTPSPPPIEQAASGADANLSASLPAAQTAQSSGNPGTAATQVSTLGSLIVIQNGAANAFAVPSGASFDSLATIIQNSVNEQVIRNVTTLNITIDAQMLAAQARLNAILNQHGLR
ncbi:hypothetical protein [Thiobacillus sp.]|uniref:hypothetical protein n=1 Tax=Thiobacillus sp. TaxID=924 RepID=UPI0025CBCE02|nr:hypothetical protein [Thiobacillus sp.]